MRRPSAVTVALLLAVMMKRADTKRGRFSELSLKRISMRTRLRAAFLVSLSDELEQFDIAILNLESRGFGMIRISSLNGAKALSVRKYIAEDLRALRRGKLDESILWQEVGGINEDDIWLDDDLAIEDVALDDLLVEEEE